MLLTAASVINPSQCRAARGLLGWTQSDLAREASLSKTSIVQFETALNGCRGETLRSIGDAFARYGIEFMPPFGVNRRAMSCRIFADPISLQQDWPTFLQSLIVADVSIRLVNWPGFTDELKQLVGVTITETASNVATGDRAAFIGDWLIMPLLDTPYRVALYRTLEKPFSD